MMLLPFVHTLTSMLIINSTMQVDVSPQIKFVLWSFIFPIIMIIGITNGAGLYLVTTVQDRDEKLRYLLNFSGMRPISYFAGITLADFTIFFIASLFFTILVWIMNIDLIIKRIWEFLFSLICFGWVHVNLCNTIGFFFTKTE